MLTISTNIQSLVAQRSLNKASSRLNQAIERMTTGFKINHASDNAANYSISTNMTTKIGAYQVAEDNVAMGLDMLTTADDSLSQIQDKLARLRALQEQASNGTYGEASLKAINTEVNAIVDEIQRLYNTTEYNGINLFGGVSSNGSSSNSGFSKPIVERDTSTMDKLADVDPTQKLAKGQYSISTVEDLQKLAEITNSGNLESGSEFVLAADIDLKGVNWTSIGTILDETDPTLASFSGTFDGNGHVIKNITNHFDDSNLDPVAGGHFGGSLFGIVAGSTNIKNLGIENINITSDPNFLASYVGGIVGANLEGTCTIENS